MREPPRDDLRDPVLAHRHAVEHVGRLHRPLLVGDDDELGVPGVPPQQSKRYGLRIIEPILDVMGIERHYIDVDSDIAKITPAITKAYETSTPVAMLIGRKPV